MDPVENTNKFSPNDKNSTADNTGANRLSSESLSLLRESATVVGQSAISDAVRALPALIIEGLPSLPGILRRFGGEDNPEGPGNGDDGGQRAAGGDGGNLSQADDQADDPKKRIWQDDEQDAPSAPHDPNDAPRGEPGDGGGRREHTIVIVNQPANAEFGPDGNITGGNEISPDGSSRTVSYRPPMKIDGEMRSVPREQLIVRPDGTTDYRYFNEQGDPHFIRQTDRDGTQSYFLRQDDGTYFGLHIGTDGSFAQGTYNADLSPRHVDEFSRNGDITSTDYTDTGASVEVLTRPDGTVKTSWVRANGSTERTSTLHPDGTTSTTAQREDGSTAYQRFSRNGELTRNIVIPHQELGPHGIVERPDGGFDLNFGTGKHPSRTVTIGSMGEVLGETSFYPGGDRRELITYNRENRTRSVQRYGPNGAVTATIHDEPLPSNPPMFN